MANRLLNIDKRLVLSNKRLFNTDAGTACCCDADFGYKFCECCDGTPCYWVADYVFGESRQPCDSIQLGVDSRTGKPVCFHRTGERRTLRELEAAGIQYVIRFGPDDGCNGASCREIRNGGPCRDCPDDCCIYGALPLCDRPNEYQCVVLAAGYRLKYKYKRHSIHSGNPIGAMFARIDPVTGQQCCFGDIQPVVREEIIEIEEEVFYNKCPTYSFDGTRKYSSIVRSYENDGYTFNDGCPGAVIPINPRIAESTFSDIDTNIIPFSLGEYPNFGVPSCDGGEEDTQRGCLNNPSDPVTYRRSRFWRAFYGRFVGSASDFQREVYFDGACACNSYSTDNQRIIESRVTQSYEIELLNNTGCERRECPTEGGPGGRIGPDGRPTSLPDGLVFPSELATQPQIVGNCAGCRQQPGL